MSSEPNHPALRCEASGYNLTGICTEATPTGRCPECGAAFDRVLLLTRGDRQQSLQRHRWAALRTVLLPGILLGLVAGPAATMMVLAWIEPIHLGSQMPKGLVEGLSAAAGIMAIICVAWAHQIACLIASPKRTSLTAPAYNGQALASKWRTFLGLLIGQLVVGAVTPFGLFFAMGILMASF